MGVPLYNQTDYYSGAKTKQSLYSFLPIPVRMLIHSDL